jgi:hypothetical protein
MRNTVVNLTLVDFKTVFKTFKNPKNQTKRSTRKRGTKKIKPQKIPNAIKLNAGHDPDFFHFFIVSQKNIQGNWKQI